MATEPRFGRLLTAMVTPFDEQGKLDLGRNIELANYLFDQGSQGLVICGTTGESPTMSEAEKLELFTVLCAEVGKRGSLIANIGTNATEASCRFLKKVNHLPLDGVMAVTPYYNKPPQEGLYRHFSTLAAATDKPFILYNVPSRCIVTIQPDTILRLAHDCENIVAVKQALGDLDQARTIIEGAPQGFEMLSGEDAATLPLMEIGATGVISVISHIVGPHLAAMIKAVVEGRGAHAAKLNQALRPVTEALFMTSNPIMVKDALKYVGFPVGGVRLPLVEPTAAEHNRLVKVLQNALPALDSCL